MTDRTVCVEVVDTGPGIDEASLPRVFDRFFHANPDSEDSGLGLSIVKAIAVRCEGSATLRNREPGKRAGWLSAI
ncbi:sensor histidine kinase [Caballeronia glathei]|uniref:sensor histidine kinase n=1 Tax=Caballeronia glathei TaxID=60547 RepID=UPI0022B29ED7|nr:ATP-binding protein [Caballeronia glathei]